MADPSLRDQIIAVLTAPGVLDQDIADAAASQADAVLAVVADARRRQEDELNELTRANAAQHNELEALRGLGRVATHYVNCPDGQPETYEAWGALVHAVRVHERLAAQPPAEP